VLRPYDFCLDILNLQDLEFVKFFYLCEVFSKFPAA
jgi:hypothetical protein